LAEEGNWFPKVRENYMIVNFTIFIRRHIYLEKGEFGGARGTYGEDRNTCTVWIGKPERRISSRRTSS